MKQKIDTLDGWRGLSILLVLAGHLLPLGPSSWRMNEAIAATGMVLFFILSGFLITSILMRDRDLKKFLIRRFMRIIPLAWLVIIITFLLTNASTHQWLSHLLFYANWPPMGLTTPTSHFWSLALEMQFYVSIAFLAFFLKEKFIWAVPVLCLAVTSYRYYHDVEMAINTYYRVDEILSGCILAVIYNRAPSTLQSMIGRLNPIVLFILLVASAHKEFELLNYFRPYIALLLIGSTLFVHDKRWWHPLLNHKYLVFIASISYALYIIHGGLRETWLGEGDTLEKYLKRPLFFIVTFALAYLSTKYYEAYWIKLGKKLTQKT